MSDWVAWVALIFSMVFPYLKGRVRSIGGLVFFFGMAAIFAVDAWHDYIKWAACASPHDLAILKPGLARQAWFDGIAGIACFVLLIIECLRHIRQARRVSGAGPGVEKPL